MSKKELKIWQIRWVELINDYDCVIDYHLEKANVVIDVLSQKERAMVCGVKVQEQRVLVEKKGINLQLSI
jgi:hypothetical protein